MKSKKQVRKARTVQQGVEVYGLQVFLLSHETFEGSGPAFAQNLDPLKIQLQNTKAGEHFHSSVSQPAGPRAGLSYSAGQKNEGRIFHVLSVPF